ncbi:uncharacterized protein LAJ45_07809 [Morchella importuna]|uniref:uncharacterized protein n=1 Tax=Morchella importuna TaxID=1174673 RepID=UPI001E8DF2AD|nr:uncharacterized protein LAJ45_07809 [Morchella importuna]KAH8148045.1 hypothetical protein LAJ45_07809 [Morchella importuna]
MNLLSLPAEIFLSITDHLFYNDLNSLLQSNHCLFYLLSPTLRTHAFTDKDGMPALHWACQHSYLSLARIILDKDTSLINCHRNKTKKAPIWHAIQGGNELIVRLLEKGAPAWTESRNRLNPPLLYIAVQNGNVEIVRLLLEHRAREYPGVSLGFLGSKPLSVAVMSGNVHMVRLLVDYGANIFGRDVCYALRMCKSEEIFELMCEVFSKDIRILMRNRDGTKGDFAMSHDAVGSGRVLMLEVLMDRAEIVGGAREHGKTLVEYAGWLGIMVDL